MWSDHYFVVGFSKSENAWQSQDEKESWSFDLMGSMKVRKKKDTQKIFLFLSSATKQKTVIFFMQPKYKIFILLLY